VKQGERFLDGGIGQRCARLGIVRCGVAGQGDGQRGRDRERHDHAVAVVAQHLVSDAVQQWHVLTGIVESVGIQSGFREADGVSLQHDHSFLGGERGPDRLGVNQRVAHDMLRGAFDLHQIAERERRIALHGGDGQPGRGQFTVGADAVGGDRTAEVDSGLEATNEGPANLAFQLGRGEANRRFHRWTGDRPREGLAGRLPEQSGERMLVDIQFVDDGVEPTADIECDDLAWVDRLRDEQRAGHADPGSFATQPLELLQERILGAELFGVDGRQGRVQCDRAQAAPVAQQDAHRHALVGNEPAR